MSSHRYDVHELRCSNVESWGRSCSPLYYIASDSSEDECDTATEVPSPRTPACIGPAVILTT